MTPADCSWVILGGPTTVAVGGNKVGTVGTNQAVGEPAIFLDAPRSATVTADGDIDVLEFGGDILVEAIRAEPQLAINLLGTAADRLRSTNALVD